MVGSLTSPTWRTSAALLFRPIGREIRAASDVHHCQRGHSPWRVLHVAALGIDKAHAPC
jgi:hypothetical protein